MTRLDELFAAPRNYDHPRLRSWLSQRERNSPKNSYIEFRREREGLSFKPARFYFSVEREDGIHTEAPEPWDAEFNDALLENRFKARDVPNEIERLGYTLIRRMQPIVNRFGDGFFNSVFLPYLDDNGYSRHQPINALRPWITTTPPAPGPSVHDCQERIDSVLARCAQQITDLGYERVQGVDILVGAIAYYLDERFSLTNRKMLGW